MAVLEHVAERLQRSSFVDLGTADLPTPITCKSGGFKKKSLEKPGD